MAGTPTDIKSKARAYTVSALETLAGISSNGKSEPARVAASIALLDRGWGKPATVLENSDTGPLQIIVSKFVEDAGE